MRKLKACLFFCLLLITSIASAQNAKITGLLQDNGGKPIADAQVRILGTDYVVNSTADGSFELANVATGDYQLEITKAQLQTLILELLVDQESIDLGTISMTVADGIDLLSSEDLIPTVVLADGDLDQDGGGSQNVSGLLTSSRDVFVNTAAFAFGTMRFRIRGYDSEHTQVYMNGIRMNSLENGRATWSLWGGLNDALRSRENIVGLAANDFTVGGVGGASQMNIRASTQWKQLRVSMAASNRSYRLRPMFIYSTGIMDNGWAFSASGSLRLAEEGQVPGSYYSAGSYYFAAEKRLTRQHALNLSIFGAPRVRGKNAATTKEQNDLYREATDSKGIYNPYWGWQTDKDGKRQKRNARYSNTHIPVAILTHDWKMNEQTQLSTSVAYQYGRNGSTALNWYNAQDPRPEYYRKWPSYFSDDPVVAEALRQQFIANPDLMQIDWDQMYAANRRSYDENFSSSETRAAFFVEERRYDNQQFSFNSLYRQFVNEKLTLNAGLRGNYYIGHNFKMIDDLLGADYHLNINNFAVRDSGATSSFVQNDVDNPNNQVKEGEIFGYDFESHIQEAALWGQTQLRLNKLELFAAAELSANRMWRKGNMKNGRFPEESAGKGKVHDFLNYNLKGGVLYKLNGRNYFFANASYSTKPPVFREYYIASRSRDQVVENQGSLGIFSSEAGYLLKAPKAKARVSGYYTTFSNDFYNRSFFIDNLNNDQGGFGNYILKNISRRHMGVELAGEYEVLAGLKVKAVASIGEHIITSRPTIKVYDDNDPYNTTVLRSADSIAYMKNAYVEGSPQMVYNFGINYSSPKYWFVNLNFNYMMRSFIGMNPDRRTYDAVAYGDNPTYQQQFVDPESQLWEDILGQEELPAVFTIDFFGGKSFRFKDAKGKAHFIYINVGVNNILNNRNIITGGYEQLRYDYENNDPTAFPNRYYYGLGTNYFISVTYRM